MREEEAKFFAESLKDSIKLSLHLVYTSLSLLLDTMYNCIREGKMTYDQLLPTLKVALDEMAKDNDVNGGEEHEFN